MKHLLYFVVTLIVLNSCSATDSVIQQDAPSSTLPTWYSANSYQSDSTSIHYFMSFQSEDSLASAKHGFKVAQIEFLNSIDDIIEQVRTQQDDGTFWDSPKVIQALRSSTYLLMDSMIANNEAIQKKMGSNFYEYYLHLSLPKDHIITELKKSTDNELGSVENFWVELDESF